MRRFNPDKELYKIQHGNKNRIILGVVTLLIILGISSSYALYQVRYSKRIIYTKVAPFSNKDINILALYLDNQPADNFPKKDSGYIFDYVDCDNGSTATFDSANWELNLKVKDKDKCNVYFKTIEENDAIEYAYNGTDGTDGKIQTFTVPINGNYKLEVWGAQGGSVLGAYVGGYGGYAAGEIFLTRGQTLYVVVGGKGVDRADTNVVENEGGFNGGGNSKADGTSTWGSGGGATHIATVNGLLSELKEHKSEILIVAGGGGGAGHYKAGNNGGSGGGYIGVTGFGGGPGHGGTQTSGGTGNSSVGSFGKGADVSSADKDGRGSGGGGGYYGGGDGWYQGSGGGGGSGYIGNDLLTNKVMYCYNCTANNNDATKTISTGYFSANAISMYAKQGDGYAKITYLGDN